MTFIYLKAFHDHWSTLTSQDYDVPVGLDIDQLSDIEVIETPGVRRARLGRVSKLLEHYDDPIHVKGEVCWNTPNISYCFFFFKMSLPERMLLTFWFT